MSNVHIFPLLSICFCLFVFHVNSRHEISRGACEECGVRESVGAHGGLTTLVDGQTMLDAVQGMEAKFVCFCVMLSLYMEMPVSVTTFLAGRRVQNAELCSTPVSLMGVYRGFTL
jgi:hypothetical protein